MRWKMLEKLLSFCKKVCVNVFQLWAVYFSDIFVCFSNVLRFKKFIGSKWIKWSLWRNCSKWKTIRNVQKSWKSSFVRRKVGYRCEDLFHELSVVFSLVKNQKMDHALDILNKIQKRNMENIVPNVVIAMRIMLTCPVSVASGERSFSKLKIIKL